MCIYIVFETLLICQCRCLDLIAFEIGMVVTELTHEMKNAFGILGVTPDADRATIRSAWRALVRSYHPDQFNENRTAANRRLAEMNAAFDLTSEWSAEDAQAYAVSHTKKGLAQRAATKSWVFQADAERKATKKRAADQRQREAVARAAAEITSHRQASEGGHQDIANSLARTRVPKYSNRKATIARKKFLDAIRELAPKAPSRDFGPV